MTLKSVTVSGLKWTFLGQVIKYPFQIIFSITLANFVSPQSFGLLGMVAVFVGLVNIFFDFGFGSFIVRSKTLNPALLHTVFWINFIIATGAGVLFIILAKPISIFYAQPELFSICIMLSGTFVLKAVTVVPESLIAHALNFKPLILRDLIAFFGSYVMAILLAAFWDLEVEAVIAQQYIQVLISIILLYSIVDWKPKFQFSIAELKSSWKYGSNLTWFSFLNYFIRNMDNFLVGKFLGANALGIYSRGYVFITSPVSQISKVFSKVMFPSLSKVVDDSDTFRKIYINTCEVIALIIFPAMILTGVTASQFVRIFLGTEWLELIPIIQVFAFLGAYQALGTTVGWIYTTQGKTDLMFKWSLYASFVSIVAFVVGVYFGSPLSMSISYAVANICFIMVPSFYIPFRLIKLPLSQFFRHLRPLLGAGFVMLVICLVISLGLENHMASWLLFLVTCGVGLVSYIVILFVFKVPVFNQVLHLAAKQFPFLSKFLKVSFE